MARTMAAGGQSRKVIPAIGNLLAWLSGPRFSCGDCDQRDRCGLPPHDDCPHRLRQIKLYGDRPRRRPAHLAAWPY